jgi:hypothetical protein
MLLLTGVDNEREKKKGQKRVGIDSIDGVRCNYVDKIFPSVGLLNHAFFCGRKECETGS